MSPGDAAGIEADQTRLAHIAEHGAQARYIWRPQARDMPRPALELHTTALDAPRSDVHAVPPLLAPRSSTQASPECQKSTPGRPPHGRPPTLGSVLAELPVLGVRRLTLLALQLATELDLALRCEVTPGSLRLESIFVENAATPLERARLPVATRQLGVPPPRASLREFGLLLAQVLVDKPLYLEESVWMPRKAGVRVLRRRADAEVVYSLGRALSLIAQRCSGGPRAYQGTPEVVRDLTKLADLTSRIVARRRAVPPVVSIHRPRMSAPRVAALPKVLLQRASLDGLARR